MSLIANGDLPVQSADISSDDFFPVVSIAQVRDFVRVDTSVTDARLAQIVYEEILDVQRLLASLTTQADHLIDLSSSKIDGKSAYEVWYFSAIANGVGAKVTEKYRNYDSTNKGGDKAAEMSHTIDEYRRNKMWALAQLQNRNQTVVALI